MASSTRIPKAELTGLYGALVKRMSRKVFGAVPDPVGVTWHNRKVLNFSFGVGRDVMEYAEAMTQTPPTVTDELSARLLKALGPAALVELTAFVALANFMARSNVAMGIESQEFSSACDLKPVAIASSA
jgi:hypothetical protein